MLNIHLFNKYKRESPEMCIHYHHRISYSKTRKYITLMKKAIYKEVKSQALLKKQKPFTKVYGNCNS